jgi:hypothetical protein
MGTSLARKLRPRRARRSRRVRAACGARACGWRGDCAQRRRRPSRRRGCRWAVPLPDRAVGKTVRPAWRRSARLRTTTTRMWATTTTARRARVRGGGGGSAGGDATPANAEACVAFFRRPHAPPRASQGHPMKPHRMRMTHDLLTKYDVLNQMEARARKTASLALCAARVPFRAGSARAWRAVALRARSLPRPRAGRDARGVRCCTTRSHATTASRCLRFSPHFGCSERSC